MIAVMKARGIELTAKAQPYLPVLV